MTDVTAIYIARYGMTYYIPTPIWTAALVTFDQHYKPGTNVPALARRIAADLIADDRYDPFGRERLTRCLLSAKGRRPGKPPATPPSAQGTLFPVS